MDKVDQFESAFRAAAKDVFHYQRLDVRSVLVVTDLDRSAAAAVEEEVRGVTSALPDVNNLNEFGSYVLQANSALKEELERNVAGLKTTLGERGVELHDLIVFLDHDAVCQSGWLVA